MSEPKPISFSRVYQGRTLRASRLSTSGRGKSAKTETSELPDWESVLGAHHSLFQDGTNYYLMALVAAAGPDCAELSGLYQRMRDGAWEPFTGKLGKRFKGMRASVAPWIKLSPTSASFEDACAKILEGSTASPEHLHLAVKDLLTKAKGDGAIQQQGRGYWPLFCKPTSKANSGSSYVMRLREYQKHMLPHVLHRAGLTADAPELAEFDLFSIATPNHGAQPKTGASARLLLEESIKHLRAVFPDEEPALAELTERLRHSTEDISIPAYSGGSVNKGALQTRFRAMLLWQFVERSPTTLRLLKRSFPEPSSNEPTAARPVADDGVPDPMTLGRGSRGYVFPAFTALPAWGPDETMEPKFSELDIAMFKEALTVISAFAQKTATRKEECAKAERRRDFMLHGGTWNAKDDGPEPTVFKDHPQLLALIRRLEKELLPQDIAPEDRDDWTYTFRESTLRGYDEVLERWQKVVASGAAFSADLYEKVKATLDEYQETHSDSIGSAHLFNYLIGGADKSAPVGDFWPLWQDPETSDLLREFGELQELEKEIKERLSQPIRFTPADAVNSRRLFRASDLGTWDKKKGKMTGSSAAVHGTDEDGRPHVDISIAVETEGVWSEQRVRLHYSAPRLARDHISDAGRWLSPKLAAMMRLADAPTQLFAKCAVSLMPEGEVQEDGTTKWHRFLLNFPLELDVTSLAQRAKQTARWKGQFNVVDTVPIHLHWPATRELSKSKPVKEAVPWHRTLSSFSCLGVDLGQRAAAAVARVEASNTKPDAKVCWDIGSAEGKAWYARLATLRLLCLPGEEADVSRPPTAAEVTAGDSGNRLRQELHGNAGRCATETETREAQSIVDALGIGDAFRLWRDDPLQKLHANADALRYFPWQNDHLLRAYRRAQGRLARWQGWLYQIKQGKDKAVRDELNEPRPPRFDDDGADAVMEQLRSLASTPSSDAETLRTTIEAAVRELRVQLPIQLERIANRVVPIRDGAWQWVKLEGENHRLQLVRGDDTRPSKAPKVRGQRGLSIERVEQLEELRKRCQSLNRALQRRIGEAAKFGARTQDMTLPDPCPELLEKLEHLKEQRVNQTAHLILAEAMGLKLIPPQLSRDERRARDVHGEYEQVREPVDFIVIEDLNRYLTSQGKAPSENSRLMKWCHRAITEKLKQLCEPLGMIVVEVGAAYSSRFSSRNGVAGFRAVEVSLKDRDRHPWKKYLEQFSDPTKKPTEEAHRAKAIFDQLERVKPVKPRSTLLWPKAGGPIFVPMSDAPPMQADLNAAINIALRAIAAPECARLSPKLRAVPQEGQLLPKAENQKETALFGKEPAAFQASGELEPTKKRGTNVFVDVGRVATSGRVTHPKLGTLPLATGKGLWSAVKAKQWERCQALNEQRMTAVR